MATDRHNAEKDRIYAELCKLRLECETNLSQTTQARAQYQRIKEEKEGQELILIQSQHEIQALKNDLSSALNIQQNTKSRLETSYEKCANIQSDLDRLQDQFGTQKVGSLLACIRKLEESNAILTSDIEGMKIERQAMAHQLELTESQCKNAVKERQLVELQVEKLEATLQATPETIREPIKEVDSQVIAMFEDEIKVLNLKIHGHLEMIAQLEAKVS